MGKILHCHFDLDYLLSRRDEELSTMLKGGTPVEIRAALVIMKAQGKIGLVVGECNNVGPDGTCAGHEKYDGKQEDLGLTDVGGGMMRLLFVLLACAVCTQLAQAAEWVPYFKSEDGDMAYLDTASVLAHGNKRVAWTKVEKATPVEYEGGLLSSWMARIEVNCIERMQRTLSEVGHQPNGSVLYQFPERLSASPVVPESMGEMRLEAMCKQRGRKLRR